MSAAPLISVVTPSFNQGPFIERCIRSVLDQQYPHFEHIVIDNQSTDETPAIVRRYRHVQWVSEPDAGQSDAVNKGIREARGEVIGWLNADDFYEPGAFAPAARALHRDTGVMAMAGGVHLREADGRHRRTVWPTLRSFDDMLRFWEGGYGLCQPGVLFRREVYERLGELRTDLHYALDYDYWLRLVRHFPIQIVDRVLANYVFHPASKSGSAAFGRGFNEELARVSRQYWGARGSRRYGRLARGCRRFLVHQLVNAIVATHKYQRRVDWDSLRRLACYGPHHLLHRHLVGVLAEQLVGERPWRTIKRVLRVGSVSAEPVCRVP